MNDKLFLGRNEKLLILHESSGMSQTNNFIITDLNTVSQVTIEKRSTFDLVDFMIQNAGENKETRERLANIINECRIKEIFYKRIELDLIFDKLKTSLIDKEKDEFYTIDKTDADYSNNMKSILTKYVSIQQAVNEIIITPENKEKLAKRNIFIKELGSILIKGNNYSTYCFEINGASKESAKIRNTTFEREKYIKDQQTI